MRDFPTKLANLFFFQILQKDLKDCRSVLDVGCGYISPIAQIPKTFKSEGIDIHKRTLDESRKRKNYDTYKLGDIRKLLSYYKPKSFDACVAIDVIEHFTKKDATRLISDMEKVARKKVIILTPNGFYEQHDFEGNPHQAHKSGWQKQDLSKLGYVVKGMRGLKKLRDDHAGIKFKPWIFWGAVALFSELFLYPFAQLSFDLYASKLMKHKK